MATDARLVNALLAAYRDGLFPMADPSTGAIDWYSPDPRALMPLAERASTTSLDTPAFHISRSLARRMRAAPFILTADTAFEQVIRACADPRPGREETWIDDRIVHAYTALHTHGHAHSLEAWLPPPNLGEPSTLVGGIYGVSIGAAFFAESMFCRPELGGTDASKICLTHLVTHLRHRGYILMDVQFRNPHIDQFGVYNVRRRAYMKLLTEAVNRTVGWGEFRHTAKAAGPGSPADE